MRNISFALTAEQVRNRTKTVTRRVGWKFAKAGDVMQPVVKGQGLKKGEKVETIGGPIRVVHVGRELLRDIIDGWPDDVALEGFPRLTRVQFVEMFCAHNGCTPDTEVTRIQFEYL